MLDRLIRSNLGILVRENRTAVLLGLGGVAAVLLISAILIIATSEAALPRVRDAFAVTDELMDQGQLSEALAVYEEETSGNHYLPAMYQELAQHYLNGDNVDKAIAVLKEGIEKTANPDLVALLETLDPEASPQEPDTSSSPAAPADTSAIPADSATSTDSAASATPADSATSTDSTASATSAASATSSPDPTTVPTASVDRSRLKKLIDSAAAIDTTLYTAESVADFQKALAAARYVHDSDSSTQPELDKQHDNLSTAMGNLQEKATETTPTPTTPEPGQAVPVSLTVFNTANDKVKDASIDIRPAEDNSKGSTVTQLQTTANGKPKESTKLLPGSYLVSVSASGYYAEEFPIAVGQSISSGGGASKENSFSLVVCKELKGNERARLVLLWDQNAGIDLDASLSGRAEGSSISYDASDEKFTIASGKIIKDIATLSGSLDTKNGPESITLLTTSGEFAYTVSQAGRENNADPQTDFDAIPLRPSSEAAETQDGAPAAGLASSGAYVKVYTPEASSPLLFELPSDVDDEWVVFTIQDGDLTNINAKDYSFVESQPVPLAARLLPVPAPRLGYLFPSFPMLAEVA